MACGAQGGNKEGKQEVIDMSKKVWPLMRKNVSSMMPWFLDKRAAITNLLITHWKKQRNWVQMDGNDF